MAAVYSAGDFRNGTTFEMDGNVYRVVEFQHVKPGKGSAFVRTKIKNVITGSVLEKHLIHQKSIQQQKLKRKICNIYMKIVDYIISWIMKHMNKYHLMQTN